MRAQSDPSQPTNSHQQQNTPPGDQDLLPGGKVPADLLAELLAALPTDDPRLVLGPGIGEDAAVIRFPADQLLVAKSDPITFATDEIGYYAVNVCANDLAVTGATPLFYLPTILLPEGEANPGMVRRVFQQLDGACRALGVTVAGGHSEITPTVNQPVIAGTMLGQVAPDRVVSSSGCQPGDVVLLAGVVPTEGTSIIAREMANVLLQRGWRREEIDQAANYLYEPGISVVAPARAAAELGLVTAMHDPTEGGIATGLLELATASDLGLEVKLDAIPITDLSRRLCAEFQLDPLGTIASGALLATGTPQKAEKLLEVWRNLGWPAVPIGRMLPQNAGVYAVRGGKRVEFPRFQVDEITKLWQ
jgi:hydrogenase maturation factor